MSDDIALDSLADESSIFEGGGSPYDPAAPVDYSHQTMELITICVCNALTLLLIITRVAVRYHRLKRFRKDDIWIMVAGGILVCPYWVCQLGTNRTGSGLHSENVPDEWLQPNFLFQIGWAGYYIVLSMVKVSVCACLLEILPHSFHIFRRLVYTLMGLLSALGLAEALVWIFQCRPFLSNFSYAVAPEWCINIDRARYAWVGLSIPLDLIIIFIPFAIIRQIRLAHHERVVLYLVFGANLLGTAACCVGVYGIWLNRQSNAYADLFWSESVYIMTNDVEILMYTLGASATVCSRYFISKAASFGGRRSGEEQSAGASEQLSWRKKMDSTFSGSVTLPSTGTGSGGERTVVGEDGDLIALSERVKGMRVLEKSVTRAEPELIDVGGLMGPKREHIRGLSRDSFKTMNGLSMGDSIEPVEESWREDPEKGERRHDQWYGGSPTATPGSPMGSPVSPAASVWDWGTRTKQ